MITKQYINLWTVKPSKKCCNSFDIVDSENKVIATANNIIDANIISASIEMLSLLREMQYFLEELKYSFPPRLPKVEEINNVIRKASGLI